MWRNIFQKISDETINIMILLLDKRKTFKSSSNAKLYKIFQKL